MNSKKTILFVADMPFWEGSRGDLERMLAVFNYLLKHYDVHLVFAGKPMKAKACRLLPADHIHVLGELPPPPSFLYRLKRKIKSWLFLQQATQAPQPKGIKTRYLSDYEDENKGLRFREIVQQLQPDVVWVERVSLGYLIDGGSTPYTTLIDTHDVMHKRCAVFQQQHKDHWLTITEEQELEVVKKFDVVVGIQEHDTNYFIKNGCKALTVYHPYAVKIETPRTFSTPQCILFVATHGFANQAALNNLHQLYQEVKGKHLEWKIVGTIGDYASTLNWGDEVAVLGRVDELDNYYMEAAIVVNPVPFGGGLKIKNVEALCWGVPLITSPTGIEGMEDGVSSGIQVCQTQEALVSSFMKLTTDAAHYNSTAKGVLFYAQQKFNEERVFQELKNVIENSSIWKRKHEYYYLMRQSGCTIINH